MRARPYIAGGLVALLMVAVAASPAAAAVPSDVPVAVLGIDFPSVKSIVEDVVKFFFGAFLDALVPDWLRDGSVDLLKRLVTVPNPTNARVWPTLATLAEAMRWISIPLVSLAAVAAWTQQWINELTGRPASFEAAVTRTAVAAVLLVSYAFFLDDAVALVNTLTNAMLSVPAVEQGLERTVGLVFAGTLLSGNGLLAALLGIAAVVLGVGLFLLSVGLLILFALLYTSAPLAIACSVVDETHGVWVAWRYTLLTAVLVPIGWCVLFATAGAFVVDMTRWSGGIAGELGMRLTGVFAALIILGLAVRWPLMLWGAIRMNIAGALMTVGAGRGIVSGPRHTVGGRAARAALQRTTLRVSDSMTQAFGAARGTRAGTTRLAVSGGGLATRGIAGASAVAGAAARPVGYAPRKAAPRRAAADGVPGRAAEVSDTRRRALESGGSAGGPIEVAAEGAARSSQRGAGRRRTTAASDSRPASKPEQGAPGAPGSQTPSRSTSPPPPTAAGSRARDGLVSSDDGGSDAGARRRSRKRPRQTMPSTRTDAAQVRPTTRTPRSGAAPQGTSAPSQAAASSPDRRARRSPSSSAPRSSAHSSSPAPVPRSPRGPAPSLPVPPSSRDRSLTSPSARSASRRSTPPRPVPRRPTSPARSQRRPDRTRKKR